MKNVTISLAKIEFLFIYVHSHSMTLSTTQQCACSTWRFFTSFELKSNRMACVFVSQKRSSLKIYRIDTTKLDEHNLVDDKRFAKCANQRREWMKQTEITQEIRGNVIQIKEIRAQRDANAKRTCCRSDTISFIPMWSVCSGNWMQRRCFVRAKLWLCVRCSCNKLSKWAT